MIIFGRGYWAAVLEVEHLDAAVSNLPVTQNPETRTAIIGHNRTAIS